MINKFPLWKNLLVIAIVLFGIIYSIPNLFGEDPAIQINATKGASVTQGDADRVLAKIKELGITPKSSELKDDQFVVRFNSEEDEFKAREEAGAPWGALHRRDEPPPQHPEDPLRHRRRAA